MFAIGEVTGAVIDIHACIGSAAGDEIEQRIALVDGRSGILVGPGEQGRFAEASVADDAERFVFLPCQMGEKARGPQPYLFHFAHRFAIFRQRRDPHHRIQPFFGNMLVAEGVSLQHPALALAAQTRRRRVGHDGFVLADPRRQRVGIDENTSRKKLRMLDHQPGDQISVARVTDRMDVAQSQGLQKIVSMLHDRGHRVVFVGFRIVGETLVDLIHADQWSTAPAPRSSGSNLRRSRRRHGSRSARREKARSGRRPLRIAGADAVHFDIFFVLHGCSLRFDVGGKHYVWCQTNPKPRTYFLRCRYPLLFTPQLAGRQAGALGQRAKLEPGHAGMGIVEPQGGGGKPAVGSRANTTARILIFHIAQYHARVVLVILDVFLTLAGSAFSALRRS